MGVLDIFHDYERKNHLRESRICQIHEYWIHELKSESAQHNSQTYLFSRTICLIKTIKFDIEGHLHN